MKEEWSIKEIAQSIRDTLEVDKDFIAEVDGETGSGKSTFAYKLAKKVCPWFDPREHVIYSRDEFIEAITNAKKGTAIVVDEAINVLFKRDFATKKQKFILRLLDMCRDRNLFLILCVPNFWALDKHILEGRIKLRFYIPRTGIGFMWKPSKNPFAPDRWYRKYNEKLTSGWDINPNARKTKGYVGYIKFGDLQDREKETYLEIKEKKKREVEAAEEEEEKRAENVNQGSFENGIYWSLLILQKLDLIKRGWQKPFSKQMHITDGALSKRINRAKGNFEKQGWNNAPEIIQEVQDRNKINIIKENNT